MILSILTIVVVLGVAYIWLTRGFFSALLHMVCVVAAGAIAFALWEPLSLMLLDHAPTKGFFAFLSGVSWAIGLAMPFAISLAVLRLSVDKLLPGNVIVTDVTNYVGGALCGAVSGIITAGILVLALGTMRLPAEFMGYKPVWYAEQSIARGSLARGKRLWLPVDWITAKLYGNLSLGTFGAGEPLAKWYPDLELVPTSMRMTFGEGPDRMGQSRNTLKKKDFAVNGWYVLGDPEQGSSFSQGGGIAGDAWEEVPQKIIDLNGEPMSRGYIAGFHVSFYSGAKEKAGGQVICGPGQVRLVCENQQTKQSSTYFPIAVISHTSESESNNYARFRFDAPNVFVPSVGGQSEVKMTFEFAVRPGDHPIALYMRNVRAVLPGDPTTTYSSTAQRDGAIRSGAFLRGGGGGINVDEIDWSDAVTVKVNERGSRDQYVLDRNTLGMVIQKGKHGSLEINEDNHVIGGEAKYSPNDLGRAGIDRRLRIDRFSSSKDISIVQVVVGMESPAGMLSKAAQLAPYDQPPVLIDSNGQTYEAVGWIYKDPNRIWVRFTPGSPLAAASEAPAISRSQTDQELTLVFRCNFGVQITGFAIGNKGIARYDPPLTLTSKQK